MTSSVSSLTTPVTHQAVSILSHWRTLSNFECSILSHTAASFPKRNQLHAISLSKQGASLAGWRLVFVLPTTTWSTWLKIESRLHVRKLGTPNSRNRGALRPL